VFARPALPPLALCSVRRHPNTPPPFPLCPPADEHSIEASFLSEAHERTQHLQVLHNPLCPAELQIERSIEASFLSEAEMVFTTLSSTQREVFQKSAARAPFHTGAVLVTCSLLPPRRDAGSCGSRGPWLLNTTHCACRSSASRRSADRRGGPVVRGGSAAAACVWRQAVSIWESSVRWWQGSAFGASVVTQPHAWALLVSANYICVTTWLPPCFPLQRGAGG